jgi:hypothetical protein
MTDETQNSNGHDAHDQARDEHDHARDDHDQARVAVESPPTLRLQNALDARAFVRCRVEELFVFHDRAFVESAFAATLGRAPDDAEMAATLADLRAARRDKREIIEDLCASNEGARAGAQVRVEGVGARGWQRRARRLPFIGYLWQLVAGVARLPTALRHQREFESFTLAQQQLIADFINEQQRRFDDERRRLDAEQRRLDEQQRQLEEQQRRISEEHWRLAESLGERLSLVQHRLDELDGHRAEFSRALADFRLAVTDAHEAISMLCDAVATLDARQADERAHLEEQRLRLEAQEEFSVQEQRAIVEAQKAVLAGIEERVAESDAVRRRALEELSRRVTALGDALEEARAQVAKQA